MSSLATSSVIAASRCSTVTAARLFAGRRGRGAGNVASRLAVSRQPEGSAPLRPWLYRVATNACLESMSVVWFPASSETFQ
jgi:hypothetical protein